LYVIDFFGVIVLQQTNLNHRQVVTSNKMNPDTVGIILSFMLPSDKYMLNKYLYREFILEVWFDGLHKNLTKDSYYVKIVSELPKKKMYHKGMLFDWAIMYASEQTITSMFGGICIDLRHVRIAIKHGRDSLAVTILKAFNGGKTHFEYQGRGRWCMNDNYDFSRVYKMAIEYNCPKTEEYIIENGQITETTLQIMIEMEQYASIQYLYQTRKAELSFALELLACCCSPLHMCMTDYVFMLNLMANDNEDICRLAQIAYHYERLDVFIAIYKQRIECLSVEIIDKISEIVLSISSYDPRPTLKPIIDAIRVHKNNE